METIQNRDIDGVICISFVDHHVDISVGNDSDKVSNYREKAFDAKEQEMKHDENQTEYEAKNEEAMNDQEANEQQESKEKELLNKQKQKDSMYILRQQHELNSTIEKLKQECKKKIKRRCGWTKVLEISDRLQSNKSQKLCPKDFRSVVNGIASGGIECKVETKQGKGSHKTLKINGRSITISKSMRNGHFVDAVMKITEDGDFLDSSLRQLNREIQSEYKKIDEKKEKKQKN